MALSETQLNTTEQLNLHEELVGAKEVSPDIAATDLVDGRSKDPGKEHIKEIVMNRDEGRSRRETRKNAKEFIGGKETEQEKIEKKTKLLTSEWILDSKAIDLYIRILSIKDKKRTEEDKHTIQLLDSYQEDFKKLFNTRLDQELRKDENIRKFQDIRKNELNWPDNSRNYTEVQSKYYNYWLQDIQTQWTDIGNEEQSVKDRIEWSNAIPYRRTDGSYDRYKLPNITMDYRSFRRMGNRGNSEMQKQSYELAEKVHTNMTNDQKLKLDLEAIIDQANR